MNKLIMALVLCLLPVGGYSAGVYFSFSKSGHHVHSGSHYRYYHGRHHRPYYREYYGRPYYYQRYNGYYWYRDRYPYRYHHNRYIRSQYRCDRHGNCRKVYFYIRRW
jgi:hypothetical protein